MAPERRLRPPPLVCSAIARAGIASLAIAFSLGGAFLLTSANAAPGSSSPGVSSGTAGGEADPVHWTAAKTRCDRKKNHCDLIGTAALHQKTESLYADFISIDLVSRIVEARGHVIYVGDMALIQCEEMNYNIDTKTGSITRGTVSNKQFTLAGERINKLGPGHFQTHHGEYSTCKDCPRSWSLLANDVDLEIDGYAFMESVITKIDDAPALWLPYLVIPIKSKRQSGFLVPRLGFAPTLGFGFVEPFFWAISRSTDATIGVGEIGGRGLRVEGEGRYKLTDGEAKINYFRTRDAAFKGTLDGGHWLSNPKYSVDRWSLFAVQHQSLPFGIEERLHYADVSDSFYPSVLPNDLAIGDPTGQFNGAAFLPSELNFSKSSPDFNSALIFRRYRNLLTRSSAIQTDPESFVDPRTFDGATVQQAPEFLVNTYPKSLFGSDFFGAVSLNATKFTRSQDFFDVDLTKDGANRKVPGFNPGIDPIREATRLSIEPRIERPFRMLDAIEGTATATFRQYYYHFNTPAVADLSRNYLQLKLDLFAQLERTFEINDPNVPRVKSVIRPLLSYSLIPYRYTPNHPFTNQIAYADQNGFTGYQLDNRDIIPLDTNSTSSNYFAPEGNAVSYGMNTALIRKRAGGGESVSYDRALDWSVGQSLNFRQISNDSGPHRPLSRVFSNLTYGFDHFDGYLDYYYLPYLDIVSGHANRHQVGTSVRYRIDNARYTKLLGYERSIAIRYSRDRAVTGAQSDVVGGTIVYSLNDYIMPSVSATYDVIPHRDYLGPHNSQWLGVDTTLTFRSPSQCWMVGSTYSLRPYCPEGSGSCSTVSLTWGVNLDGNGYNGLPGGG